MLIVGTLPVMSVAAAPDRRVVVLHSYHQGFKWTDDIVSGIKEGLKDYPGKIELIHEYMDSKRRWDNNYKMLLEGLLNYKYHKMQPDAVILSDNVAFEYMCDTGKHVFPGVPVFFCGVNYLDPHDLKDHPNFTGISEAVDIEKNLNLILQLHPHTREIAFVVESTETGHIIAAHLEQLQEKFSGRLKLSQFTDLTFAELEKEIAALPHDSVVIMSIFFRDREGSFLEFDESARKVANASRVPVYCLWDFSLGYGPVGGYLTTGYEQGFAVAGMVMQSFSGMLTAGIPVRYEPVTSPKFDWQAMKKFGVNASQLPPGSTIIGRPPGLNEQFQGLLFAGVVVLSIFLGVSLLYTHHIQARVRELTQKSGEAKNAAETVADGEQTGGAEKL